MTEANEDAQGPGRVGVRLYAASRHHASEARARRSSPNEIDRLDGAWHAGAAVELIAKAALHEADPRLLSDGADAQHALLEAVAEVHGKSDALPAAPKPGPRTIGAATAVALVSRLDSGAQQHESAANRVLRLRNAAVHMAEIPTAAQLTTAVTGMEGFVDAVAVLLHGSSHDYWGVDFDEVTAERRAAERATEASATEKVRVAAAGFHQFVEQLPDDVRTAVLAYLQGRDTAGSADVSGSVDCPACRNEATVTWDIDVDAEEELPGEYTYTSFFAPSGLRCPVCGLSLDPEEVDALGIDVGDAADYVDYEPPDDYRDEERWYAEP